MSYQMKADELLEALHTIDSNLAAHFENIVVGAANAMAEIVAERLGIVTGVGSFEGVGFAGTCVPMLPAYQGQPLPDAIAHYDEAEEWEDCAKDETLPVKPSEGGAQ